MRSDETPVEAMYRELEEETGYRAARMESLGEYYSSPGMVSESFTLLRATGLERVGDGGGVQRAVVACLHGPMLARAGP